MPLTTTLRARAAVPPIVLPVPSTSMPMPPLRSAAAPVASTDTRFPATTLARAVAAIDTPTPVLPAITLAAPSASPPIVLSRALPPISTPTALPRACVPAGSVPTRLPRTTLDRPARSIPGPLTVPAITLRSATAVPPIVAAAAASTRMPASELPRTAAPSAVSPNTLPWTRWPVPRYRRSPRWPLLLETLPVKTSGPVASWRVPEKRCPRAVVPSDARPIQLPRTVTVAPPLSAAT